MTSTIPSVPTSSHAAPSANAASSTASGSTTPLAAVSPAPPTANRSYANATKKPVVAAPAIASSTPAVAVGASAQHAKSTSISPVNGKPNIQPAVPNMSGPAIVNSSAIVNGGAAAPNDHTRKPSSVTISATGTSGNIPNGGAVGGTSKPSINFGNFGSINSQGSPAIVNSVPNHPQNAGLSAPQNNPRITSPANSPSPIPQPVLASGGRPPTTLNQGSSHGLNFGSMGGDGGDHLRPSMPQGPAAGPQAQHLRRESSQSAHGDMGPGMNNMNRNFVPQGRGAPYGRPGSGYPQQMANSPSMAYRQLNQPMTPRTAANMPHFGGQGQVRPGMGSPYQANRSPAMPPAQMHHAHMGNPQMNYSNYPQPHLQPQYNMQPGYDPSYGGNAYYQMQGYPGQGMPYPGIPQSPRPFSQTPHNQPPFIPGQYHGPNAPGMTRTPSQNERPPSGPPQTPSMVAPQATHTPAQPSVSPAPASSNFTIPAKTKSKAIQIKNADGEVISFGKTRESSSPAPSTSATKAPAVVSSTPTPTPPPRPTSATTPTHARSESTAVKSTADAEKAKADFVAQFNKQLKPEAKAKEDEDKAAEEKLAKDKAAAEAKAVKAKEEADAAASKLKELEAAKAKEEEAAKAKAAAEAAKAEADKADAEKAKAEKAEAEKVEAEKAEAEKAQQATDAKSKDVPEEEDEDARMERMIAEMEAAAEEEERRAAEYKAKKDKEIAEQKKLDAEKKANPDDELKRLEREAEEREEAKEKERAAAAGKSDSDLFAALKKPTLGPGASGMPSESGATTPVSDSSLAPPLQPLQGKGLPAAALKQKPAALKLETGKPVEPAQPTAGMQALKSARLLQVKEIDSVKYPNGILSPNPAVNNISKSQGIQYSKDFLMQFQDVFKEKPSLDWDAKVKETIGDGSDSARPQSARTPSMGGRQGSNRPGVPSGLSGGVMGSFVGGRTLPPGTTSEARFQMSQQGTGGGGGGGGSQRGNASMANPFAQFGRPGGAQFQMGGGVPSGMQRTGSSTSLAQGGGMNSPRQASGRGRSHRQKQNPHEEAQKAKTMPLTANMDLKPLQASGAGWKPLSLAQTGPPVVAAGRLEPDMVQRKVKAALNKMAPEKFDRIADQILDIAAQSKDETDGRTLRQVIQLTFEKACDEAHWASMYAKFCKRMLETMSTDIKDENVRDKNDKPIVGGALFRKYLLNRCQEEFERGWEVDLPEQPQGGGEAVMLSEEYYIAAAAKRRGLGLIQFIGELYKLGMLTLRIMHECVHKLLDFEGLPDESAIESLVKLLRTVGATMDAAENGPKMIQAYFDRINNLQKMEGLNSRLRFMLLDMIDLRKNNWRSKDDAKGPKTLAEVHQDAMAAQQQADMDRQRSNQRGPGGRPPMGGRNDTRNYSQNNHNSMPPPQTVGRDDLLKLTKGASSRNFSQGGGPGTLGPSSMFGSRSSSGRKGVGLGPIGRAEESGPSSRTGTPPVKEKDSVVSVNAYSALAQLDATGETGDDVASPPSVAASPALTKAKPADAGGKPDSATKEGGGSAAA
ncbi:hypothetical protein K402DRAFT_420620 [Aulographum hederae CBS 113979]|uniref:MIF4G domain-containing protein n=1 Tax=Aulographum hederae CBS 113979 TaxID=1176131 RepID=A0A6G1H160_9PEZI|nr:hypothetical protein K402DRAFT_420620 [Aulographum hederae CBS 113979]